VVVDVQDPLRPSSHFSLLTCVSITATFSLGGSHWPLFCSYIFTIFLVVQGFEARALHILGKCYTPLPFTVISFMGECYLTSQALD
jgi:hypothetical protein